LREILKESGLNVSDLQSSTVLRGGKKVKF